MVLDDGSTDGTADVVRAVAGDKVRLLTGAAAGRLARQAVRLPATRRRRAGGRRAGLRGRRRGARTGRDRRARSVRWPGSTLLSPYPRITGAGRLVQPLLQWSWLTFLPLRAMERSPRPSLAAAGGQWLVFDRAGYDRAGGHAAVRGEVLEDIALARAVKRSGGRIALADGSRLATCRMYGSWPALVDGYSKSLWASFGSPAGAAAVVVLLLLLYAVPPALAPGLVAGGARRPPTCSGWPAGWSSAAGHRRTRLAGRAAHPASVVVFAWLVARSFRLRHRAGPADLAGTAGVSRVVVIGAGSAASRGDPAGAGRARRGGARAVRGGRRQARPVRRDGFAFDTGPSLLTLPQVFDDLDLGLSPRPLDPVVRHVFPDGSVLDSSSDHDVFVSRIADAFGARRGRRLGPLLAAGGAHLAGVVAFGAATPGHPGTLAALSWRLTDLRAIAPGRSLRALGFALPARPATAHDAGPVRHVRRRRPAPGTGRAGRDPLRGTRLRRLVPARRPGHPGRPPCWPGAPRWASRWC